MHQKVYKSFTAIVLMGGLAMGGVIGTGEVAIAVQPPIAAVASASPEVIKPMDTPPPPPGYTYCRENQSPAIWVPGNDSTGYPVAFYYCLATGTIPPVNSRVAANSVTKIHATEVGGQSIVGNLTETNAAAAGFITAYPCTEGLPHPLTSNINFNAGVDVANGVTVKADANGDVCLTPSVATDMVWDQVVETSAFATHNAVRKLDTRAA